MPIYTYRCPQGHTWDEVRSYEGSETSQEPCRTCLEGLDRAGVDLDNTGEPGHEDLSEFAGKKVPAQFGVAFKGQGWTPKFHPNQKGK